MIEPERSMTKAAGIALCVLVCAFGFAWVLVDCEQSDGHSHGGHSHGHGHRDPELYEHEDHRHLYYKPQEDDGHEHGHEGHGHSHGEHAHGHGGHAHNHEEHGHGHEGHGHSHGGHGHGHLDPEDYEHEDHRHLYYKPKEEPGHEHGKPSPKTDGSRSKKEPSSKPVKDRFDFSTWVNALGATFLISAAPYLLLFLIPLDKNNRRTATLSEGPVEFCFRRFAGRRVFAFNSTCSFATFSPRGRWVTFSLAFAFPWRGTRPRPKYDRRTLGSRRHCGVSDR